MDDVRNLRQTGEVTLKAFNDQNEPITIDATQISNEPDPNMKKPINTVSITPNIKKRAPRRTVEESKSIEINPEDFIEKNNEKEEVHLDTIRDTAFTQLDATVKRKKDEYHEFVKKAMIDDQVNRERIADGIEEAPNEEIKYRPEDLPKEVTKDPNGKEVVVEDRDEIEDIEAELDIELNRSNDFESEINTTKTIASQIPDNIKLTEVDEEGTTGDEIKLYTKTTIIVKIFCN